MIIMRETSYFVKKEIKIIKNQRLLESDALLSRTKQRYILQILYLKEINKDNNHLT